MFEKKKIAVAKITMRKQISLPKKVQDALGGIEEEQYVIFYQENKRVFIEKGDIIPIK